MGRPLEGNEMKRMNGTDRPYKMREEMAGLNPLTSVEIPKCLKTISAKRIFRDKADQLISIRVLTELDIDMLILWAQSEDITFECIKIMKKDGMFITKTKGEKIRKLKDTPIGFKSYDETPKVKKRIAPEVRITGYIIHPVMKLYNENVKILDRLAAHFGFSPAARTKMYANIGEGKKKNKFEGF